MLSVVPVGGGLPVTTHVNVTSELLEALVSTRVLSNLGAPAGPSSSDEVPGNNRSGLCVKN